jgi:hypothetical protein
MCQKTACCFYFLGYIRIIGLWGEIQVLRTIILGSCVSVQGLLVKKLDNGKIVIRVGDRIYEGMPVAKLA